MSERSSNFICITLAVLVLATALPHRQHPTTPRSRFLLRASYPDCKAPHHLFGDLAAVVDIFHVSLTSQGKTEELMAAAVQPNFFQLIGVEPVMGRGFREGADSGDHEVILSYRLWQRRFQSSAKMVGRNITLEDKAYRVIGILPADFTWNNRETDVWVPCAPESRDAGSYISQVRLDVRRGRTAFEPKI